MYGIDPSLQRSDFDATAAVRDWISNPSSEHGLLLKATYKGAAPATAGTATEPTTATVPTVPTTAAVSP